MTKVPPKECDLSYNHQGHEWTNFGNLYWCQGKVEHCRHCGRKIEVMIRQGTGYCCLNCEKLAKGDPTAFPT